MRYSFALKTRFDVLKFRKGLTGGIYYFSYMFAKKRGKKQIKYKNHYLKIFIITFVEMYCARMGALQ